MTRFLTLTLALLIAVTSQQMAMARGMAKDASGQVILCTGQGLVTVTLDAQGNPLNEGAPLHICPDCALALMATVDAPILLEAPVVHIQILGQTPVLTCDIPIVPTSGQARGPPPVV